MDNQLKDLEVMVSLFESKLSSLPEDIVNKYPPLSYIKLGDYSNINYDAVASNIINVANNEQVKETNNNNNKFSDNSLDKQIKTDIEIKDNENNSNNNNNNTIDTNTDNIKERSNTDKKEEDQKNDENENSPEKKLANMLSLFPQLEVLNKSLKLGIPSGAVLQKAKLNSIDDIVAKDFVDLYRIINPNVI